MLGAGAVACLVLLGSATFQLGTSVGAAAAAPSGGAAAPGAGQSVPHPGSSSNLFGVSCASPGSCWAVGAYLNGNRTDVNQALHWNGTKWSLTATPDPGGTGAGAFRLNGVACATSADCWAVGRYISGNGADLNQALHWNGARWSSAFVPSPGGTALYDVSELNGVRCTSSADCWAVGDYFNANRASLNQALHWNGRTWSLAATPDPGGTGAFAFSALNGVACATSADCWAVGRYVSGNRTNVNQALHWNGRKWSLAATPDLGGTGAGAFSTLRGVACATSADCWAAGSAFTSAGALVNQALHWNGRTWSLAATPDPGWHRWGRQQLPARCGLRRTG
jgi:hypothetical protein